MHLTRRSAALLQHAEAVPAGACAAAPLRAAIPQRRCHAATAVRRLEGGRPLVACHAAPQAATAAAPQAKSPQEDPWRQLVEKEERGEIIEVQVKRFNKGGLVVSVGQLEGFMPFKQLANTSIRKGHLGDLSYLVGQKLKARIVTVDMQGPKREIILSEKKALLTETLRRIKVGQVMRGIVRAVEEYGLFVDLLDVPGVSGLVHKSEISWDPVIDVFTAALPQGTPVTVKVSDVEPQRCRLALSIKQLTLDPLKQTLDTLVWGPTTKVSPDMQRLIDRLEVDPRVEGVVIGRQATDARHVSQELQVFLTRAGPSGPSPASSMDYADGVAGGPDGNHLMVARLGPVLQELQLITKGLTREQVKALLQSVVKAGV